MQAQKKILIIVLLFGYVACLFTKQEELNRFHHSFRLSKLLVHDLKHHMSHAQKVELCKLCRVKRIDQLEHSLVPLYTLAACYDKAQEIVEEHLLLTMKTILQDEYTKRSEIERKPTSKKRYVAYQDHVTTYKHVLKKCEEDAIKAGLYEHFDDIQLNDVNILNANPTIVPYESIKDALKLIQHRLLKISLNNKKNNLNN